MVGLAASGLSSCSSARYFDFSTSSSSSGAYHRSPVATPALAVAPALMTAEVVVEPLAEPTELTASTAPQVATPTPAAPAVARAAAPAKLSEQLTTARAERTLTRGQNRRYEQVLKRVKAEETRREAAGLQVDAVELILAIFLPPIGVLLHEGGKLTTRFWISLILTLLFFFPGMIYSILVVTNTI
jgi:uncharacterized membrane protein YqaE (UPF0057 family)